MFLLYFQIWRCINPSQRVSGAVRRLPVYLVSTYRQRALELGDPPMMNAILRLWQDDSGQDVAEYAVMLAVVLIIVIGTIQLIGSRANTVFSEAASNMAN